MKSWVGKDFKIRGREGEMGKGKRGEEGKEGVEGKGRWGREGEKGKGSTQGECKNIWRMEG